MEIAEKEKLTQIKPTSGHTGVADIHLANRMTDCSEAATLKIAARAAELRAEGKSIISLSTGEPNFPTPQNIKDAAVVAIEKNFTKYTPAEGLPQLRELVAQKFQHDNGIETNAHNIQISSGGKHALFNAVAALTQRGDEVIIPSPFWVSYPAMVSLSEAKTVLVETHVENDWLMSADDLRQAITPRTRMLIMNTPVNPTSAMYEEEHLRALVPAIKESGIYVLVDELYEKLTYDGLKHFSIGSVKEIADQVITVNGMSKAYAMTGWRIGYATGRHEVIEAMNRLQSQAVSHPSSISQYAAIEALSGPQDTIETMRAEFEKRRDLVVEIMSKIPGIKFSKPKAAFYVFFDISGFIGAQTKHGIRIDSAEEICESLLEDYGLAMVPGNAFGKSDAIRMSFAASKEDIVEGLSRLRDGLAAIH